MTSEEDILTKVATTEYKYGFVSDFESESAAVGLNEDTIRFISKKKKRKTEEHL